MGELRRRQAPAELQRRQPGLRRSHRPAPSQAYMDRDHNGFLSDFERDADGDGIPNMDESRAPATGDGPDTVYRLTRPARLRSPTSASSRPDYLESADSRRDARPQEVRGHQPGPLLLRRPHDRREQGRHARAGSRPTPTATACRDGADDVDHDGVSTSTSTCARSTRRPGTATTASSTRATRTSTPRFCLIGSEDIHGDGIPNRFDTDVDRDGLARGGRAASTPRLAAGRHRRPTASPTATSTGRPGRARGRPTGRASWVRGARAPRGAAR